MSKLLNCFVLAPLLLLLTNTLYAQATPKGLSVALDNESQSIQVQKKGSDVTGDYLVEAIELDVYDANSGEYSGTLDLATWNIPLGEFTDSDVILVTSVKMTHKESGMVFTMNPETQIYPRE